MLSDAARFSRSDVALADIVEQRRLTVVNVTHYRNDMRTLHEIFAHFADAHDILEPVFRRLIEL